MQALNRGKKTADKKGWVKGVILIVAWILIISLAKDLLKVKSGFDRIEESKGRLIEEQRKNEELKIKLETVLTEEYKERIIREQLNMQKADEIVAVLPRNTIENGENEAESVEDVNNWEKWFALLK